jgi:trk system potassium uptake protein TrkH
MQIKVDGEPVADDLLAGIVAVVLMYITIAMVAGAAMTAFTPNIETAISSVITTLSGCGPGLGAVGPMLTYAGIPAAGQLILCACMLLGRLEFFTLLVLFLPRFWRR